MRCVESKAYEFEAHVKNGMIQIPPQIYNENFPSFVRVIILFDEVDKILKPKLDEATLARRKAAMERLDGCLAGMDVDEDKMKAERLARQ